MNNGEKNSEECIDIHALFFSNYPVGYCIRGSSFRNTKIVKRGSNMHKNASTIYSIAVRSIRYDRSEAIC